MTLTCREFVEFILAYQSRELPDEQRGAFEAHLALCPPCVQYLRTYEVTAELPGKCAELDRDGPPADMPEALVRAILAARKKG